MRFSIRWTGDQYRLTIPNYTGGEVVTIDEYEQALAEKDAEIVQWKAAHDEMVSRNRLFRDRPDLPADRIRAYDEWVQKYQQLMEQAVRFAEAFEVIANDNGRTCIEVQQFLNSPEVQAWKERKVHHG